MAFIFENPKGDPYLIEYSEHHPEGQPYYKEALNNCMCRINRNMAANCEINCYMFTEVYWCHPDYLGNTEYVSDIGGFIYQHFYYTPFGEALISQHANTCRYDTEFWFNGKEQYPELQGAAITRNNYDTNNTLQSRIHLKSKQDYEQTGLCYYGARYYEPRVSVWLSVDPHYFNYSNWTPYHYAINNPENVINPDERDTVDISLNNNGFWEISNTQTAEGDDVFRVYHNGETSSYTINEGDYGDRVNMLNLELTDDYALGVYHVSGAAESEGGVGFFETLMDGRCVPLFDSRQSSRATFNFSKLLGAQNISDKRVGKHCRMTATFVRDNLGTFNVKSAF